MIRAGCQALLAKQARFLVGAPFRLMGSSSPSTQDRLSFEEETFSTLIDSQGVYVNKIPKLVPLLKNQSQSIALTAPRRMGKSMTLQTLYLMKLLGLKDFLRVLEKEGYTDMTGKIEKAMESIITKKNQDLYYHPQPTIILLPKGAINQQQWASSLQDGLYESRDTLMEFNQILEGGQSDEETSKLRKGLIKEYERAIKRPYSLRLFQRKGALFMIDEYDSDYTSNSSPKELKEFARHKTNQIFGKLKGRKLIIAGVYNPATIGFNDSTANSFKHFTEIKMNANSIPFTKIEVERHYYGTIEEGIKNLPEENKEKLILEIKKHFRFTEDSQEEKKEKETIDTTEGRGKDEVAPVKVVRGKFDESKLAQYVIDVIFWMHDGFNLHKRKVPPKENFIVSPSVVVKVVSRIKNSEQQFFDWGDYMDSALHTHIEQLFTADTYLSLPAETKADLISLLKNGKITVAKRLLKAGKGSINNMSPIQILFQEGLLSVQEVTGEEIVLGIPNYGVKQYLMDLKSKIPAGFENLMANLFRKTLSPGTKESQMFRLLVENSARACKYAKDRLGGGQSLSERSFSSNFCKFLEEMMDAPQYYDFRHQKPYVRKVDKDAGLNPHNKELLPDISITDIQTEKSVVIEVCRKATEQQFQDKVDKYDQLNPEEVIAVVIANYNDKFTELKKFKMFNPSGEEMEEKPKK